MKNIPYNNTYFCLAYQVEIKSPRMKVFVGIVKIVLFVLMKNPTWSWIHVFFFLSNSYFEVSNPQYLTKGIKTN